MWELIGTIIGLFVIYAVIKDEISLNKRERNATKRCSSCGMQIPMKATICPYCRRKPGSDFRAESQVYGKGLGKFIFVIIIIGIILARLKIQI